jgi:hypothetical protein
MHRNLGSNKTMEKVCTNFPSFSCLWSWQKMFNQRLQCSHRVYEGYTLTTALVANLIRHPRCVFSQYNEITFTEGYISAYGRNSSKLYKYVAHLELPSVPISFLDHSKNVTIVWEKRTYLANATNMYKLQSCIRLPWIACGTIQRQTSSHECSGSHSTIWDWRK